jgi:hypothetical protein
MARAMGWWIRTHDGELELLLAVELRGDRAAASTELPPDEAVATIGRLASDPRHLSTLRDVYLQLGTNTGGSVSDFIIVPSLFDAVHMGRVVVRWKPRDTGRTERVTSESTDEVTLLAALADLAAPEPEPAALAPAIVHQIRILRSASESAAPLAEECECE